MITAPGGGIVTVMEKFGASRELLVAEAFRWTLEYVKYLETQNGE
jgi:hypothetical protein